MDNFFIKKGLYNDNLYFPADRRTTRLGIEIDEVVRDFIGRLIEVYRSHYPEHTITPREEWSHYSLQDYFPIRNDIYDFFVKQVPYEIYLQASVLEGAREMLEELRKYANITLISSQPTKEIERLTLEWLEKNSIPFNDVLFTYEKERYRGLYLLDDCAFNLERVRKAKRAVPVMYEGEYPWHEKWEGLRVKKHKDFTELAGFAQ